MAFGIESEDPSDVLPNVSVPGVSYAAVGKVTSRAASVASALEGKVRSYLASALTDAANSLGAVAIRVAKPITSSLSAAEGLVSDLGTQAVNTIAGQLQPAVATLGAFGVSPSGVATVPGGTSGAGVIGGAASTSSRQPPMAVGAAGILPSPAPAAGSASLPQGSIYQFDASGNYQPVDALPDTGPCDPNTFLLTGVIQQNANAGAVQIMARYPADPNNPGSTWGVFLGYDCCTYLVNFDLLPSGFTVQGQTVVPQFGLSQQGAFAVAQQVAGYLSSQNITCQLGGPPPPPPPPPPHHLPPPPPPPPICPPVTSPCPPPVINIPPCPPPPPLKFDSCIQIDLCNWQALCDTLKNCLTQANKSGDCNLDNESAWAFQDCTGTFTSQMTDYLGDVWTNVLGQSDLQTAAAGAFGPGDVVDPSEVAGPYFLGPPPPE